MAKGGLQGKTCHHPGRNTEAIVANETKPERRAFYQLAWHLGAAQTDLATLTDKDVDWEQKTICFFRRKTGAVVRLHFGSAVAAILQDLPENRPLVSRYCPNVRRRPVHPVQKALHRLNITGVTLHSYRYAWAERAKTAGYPERFAQEALGHKSQAVHWSYAKRAKMLLPTLEDYEKKAETPLTPVAG